jgi:hypothetical protein
MYKFIPYEEYIATEEVTDEEGNVSVIHTSPYWTSHSHARVNYEQTEVVLSCSSHTETCDCISKEEAHAHIDANWVKAPEQEV